MMPDANWKTDIWIGKLLVCSVALAGRKPFCAPRLSWDVKHFELIRVRSHFTVWNCDSRELNKALLTKSLTWKHTQSCSALIPKFALWFLDKHCLFSQPLWRSSCRSLFAFLSQQRLPRLAGDCVNFATKSARRQNTFYLCTSPLGWLLTEGWGFKYNSSTEMMS